MSGTPRQPGPTLRQALRHATAFPIAEQLIADSLDEENPADADFARVRSKGLAHVQAAQRHPELARVTGEVAESVAQLMLDEQGYSLFWQIPTPGVHGVDLLLLAPDGSAVALEVKGTLRPQAIPRLTPSRQRQMSRDWLNNPRNPGMVDWSLRAEDLYAAVIVIDLALAQFRAAVSADFETYQPITRLDELASPSRHAEHAARSRIAAAAQS